MFDKNGSGKKMLINIVQDSLAAQAEPDALAPSPLQNPIQFESAHICWSIHRVRDTVELYHLIAQLTWLTDGCTSGSQKFVIVSDDFRVGLALNAFIRFYAPLDGMIYHAETTAEAYAVIASFSEPQSPLDDQ